LTREIKGTCTLNPEKLKLKLFDVGHAYKEEMDAEVIQWFTEHL